MEQIVYVNGSLLPLSKARLSPLDSGFMYGCGLFETLRAYSGNVFRLQRHLDRLRRSSHLLGISLVDAPDLEKAVYDTLSANRLSDARIRITISGGELQTIPDLQNHQSPTIVITAGDYPGDAARTDQRRGYRAIISAIRRNTHSQVSAAKSLCYLDSLLARREAGVAGVNEAILMNERGFIAEGSTSNIFIVSADTLLTPGETSGILPGITRQVILEELAPSLEIRTAFRDVSTDELAQADEAFLTNSIIEVVPLTEINGHAIGDGRPGKITNRLLGAYHRLVESAVAGG